MTFSRDNEDEVLSRLIARLPSCGEVCVDIGAKAMENSNVANLIVNHGWTGVLFDRGVKNFQRLISDFKGYPICISQTRITPNNVNKFMPPDCDLLSIDIDGQDYYVWQAIEARPSIVVIEYNHRRQTGVMSRDDRYEWKRNKPYDTFGASFDAMVALGVSKDYTLATHNQDNLFFVDSDVEI